jgi:hypothetical protein
VLNSRQVSIPHDQLPSWSWISLSGHVLWQRQHARQEIYAKLLDANVVLSGFDPFGEIDYAAVLLGCCSLFKGSFLRTPSRFILEDDSQWLSNLSFDWKEKPNGVIYFLPLLDDTGDDDNFDKVIGLMLQRTGSSRGQYRRVGVFETLGREFGTMIKDAPCILKDSEYIEILNLEDSSI